MARLYGGVLNPYLQLEVQRPLAASHNLIPFVSYSFKGLDPQKKDCTRIYVGPLYLIRTSPFINIGRHLDSEQLDRGNSISAWHMEKPVPFAKCLSIPTHLLILPHTVVLANVFSGFLFRILHSKLLLKLVPHATASFLRRRYCWKKAPISDLRHIQEIFSSSTVLNQYFTLYGRTGTSTSCPESFVSSPHGFFICAFKPASLVVISG